MNKADAGLEAVVTCVDTEQRDVSFVGRSYDPCAENGEFHTVAVAGPMFYEPLDVEVGEVVDRQRFVFAETILRDSPAAGGRSGKLRKSRGTMHPCDRNCGSPQSVLKLEELQYLHSMTLP